MNNKKSRIFNAKIIIILLFALTALPAALARFTTKKNYNGSLNVNNHPCDKFKKIKSMGKEFTVKLCTPDFSKNATTKEGMFMAEDEYGESYYYRGAADNWVSFAGFYWRIIRINGDGSIRLIYSGTKTSHTGDGAQIGISAYNPKYDNQKYADYKISTIKTVVENWYKTNIMDKGYNNTIADTGYCNDMSKMSTGDFGSYDRLYNNKIPTIKCPNKESDLLSKGNGKLMYPIGLLTWDEAAFAGGVSGLSNASYYLMAGNFYRTMTPAGWGGYVVGIAAINRDGTLDSYGGIGAVGVRPVLSLKSSVTITSGDGTESNPFIIN